MKKTQNTAIAFAAVFLTVLSGMVLAQQDKYTLQVPGGLAFSEFRGYEGWQVVSISQNDKLVAAILANPVMIGRLPGRHSRQRHHLNINRQASVGVPHSA